MLDAHAPLFATDQPDRRIRLRTLTALRWAAIVGQLAAIAISLPLFSLQIAFGPVAIAIGASVIANLVVHFVYPKNKWLGAREATLMLAFDTVQLGALLAVTGGLNNPFVMLIIAPVTVAAMTLPLASLMIIGVTAVALASGMGWAFLPLTTTTGTLLALPDIFAFGHWAAVITAILFVGVYTRQVSTEIHSMSQGLLATQMALAREQKLTDLGGVVAAAAHELGTPLATIKLVSAEMIDELDDSSDLQDDARLIRDQANRCADILRSMGRSGKDDLHLHQALLSAILEEAAEPHRDRGKTIIVKGAPDETPMVLRRPELVHGLRNLIQNAVDFAATTVWVEAVATERMLSVRVTDDGTGYPPHLIGRIGEPFLRRSPRQDRDARRPEYEGMGLGLFIAKTLLERTGAELNFVNGSDTYTGAAHPGDPLGAIVEVRWNRGRGQSGIEADDPTPVLGENERFDA